MKAVIMAGGEGSRLRPLTCDIPKPMARLCGRPVMEYILDLLVGHGIDEAAVTLRYLPDRISEHFPDGSYKGVRLSFCEEDQPLGTAGSVKNACSDEDREVLIISGDAMCDFDLTSAVRFHREGGADVTILAKKVGDPREYGLIDVTADGGVNAFIEKPAFSQAISDLANTGIYILSKNALDLIPRGKSYDFAKDLFPLMLKQGMTLKCFQAEGYWCDIGDLESYIRCQQDMLAGKVQCQLPGDRDKQGSILLGSAPPADCTVEGPVYIGRNVTVESGVHIGGGTVIDDGCYIGRGARIRGSVLLQDSYVGDRARLTGALICAAGTVKAGAMLFECATVGAGAVVGEKATLQAGIKVWNKKTVPPSAVVDQHVKTGAATQGFFEENGITGEVGVELTPEFCARIGSAVGSMNPRERIAVGCDSHPSAEILKAALCAGIQSTGAGVLDFGENFQALFEFSMNFCSAHLGVYIRGGSRAGLKVLETGGLPASREIERSVEGILARGEFVRCAYDRMGDRVEMTGMTALYNSQLIRFAAKGLTGCSARVSSHNLAVQNILRQNLSKLGCDVDRGFTLEVSAQGDKVRIRDDRAGYVPHHKILTWCAAGEMEKGSDIAVPFDSPRALEEIARQYDRRLLRYYDCPADRSDGEARRMAQAQMWSRDGLMQAVMLMNLLKRRGSLQAVAGHLPGFDMAQRMVETQGNPAGLLRKINTERSGAITEGVLYRGKKGVALVKPLKRGTGIKIMAEALSAEIAAEICDEVERLIQTPGEDNTPPLT